MSATLRRAAVLSALVAGNAAAQVCAMPASNSDSVGHLLPAAGAYELTMVADSGSRKGMSVRGVVEIERSRSADGKLFRAGQGFGQDTTFRPMIGWAQIDLSTVGAPMAPSGDTEHPRPGSRNPIAPGVVVLGPSEANKRGAVRLLIGTLTNIRDGTFGLDGFGIQLQVRESSATMLRGVWDHWGIVADGSGHFCLRPVAP